MTNAHAKHATTPWRRLLPVATLVLTLFAAGDAVAQTSTVPPPPPRPAPPPPQRSVLIVHPTPAEHARQQVRQQHLRGVLRNRALQEQIRRRSAATTRLPSRQHPQLQQQLRQADNAQQRAAEVRRADLLERYRRAALPPPAASTLEHAQPAPARSGG